MTPEETAKELYVKFYSIPIVRYNKEYHYSIGDVIKSSAKQMKDKTNHIKVCALLCVDEIISSFPSMLIESDNVTFYSDIEESTKYWKEVKRILENDY